VSEIAPVVAPVAPSATPSVEAAPAPEPKPERVLKGRAALKERLTKSANAVMDGAMDAQKFKDESPSPTPSATPQPETVKAAVADLEKAGVEVPEQKATETKTQYATKIAQLMLAVQRSEAESLKHKGSLEKVTAERDELKARLTEASSDPVKALRLANMSPDELAQAMLDGKLTKAEEKVVKQELPDEVKELIEEGKRLKAEKQAQVEAAEAAKVREANVKIIDTAKKGLAEQFPALDLIPSDRLLAAYEQITAATGEEPDFTEFAGKFQESVVSEVLSAVRHKGTLLELVKKDPELKAFLATELGLSAVKLATDPEAVKDGDFTMEAPKRSSIGGVVNESAGKKKDMSAAERKARAAAAAGKIFG
jgi:hypothetical protein